MNKVTKTLAITGTVLGLTFGIATTAEAKHTVKPGDTLSKLATMYNTTIPNITKENPHITDINLIYVGDVLEGIGNETVATKVTTSTQTTTTTRKVYTKAVNPVNHTTSQSPTGKAYTKEVVPSDNGSEYAAKEWIAYKESRGDYNARSSTGKYIGRYQLTNTYLNGDYSPANQERVASKYVKDRYGSWRNAKKHHEKFGYY